MDLIEKLEQFHNDFIKDNDKDIEDIAPEFLELIHQLASTSSGKKQHEKIIDIIANIQTAIRELKQLRSQERAHPDQKTKEERSQLETNTRKNINDFLYGDLYKRYKESSSQKVPQIRPEPLSTEKHNLSPDSNKRSAPQTQTQIQLEPKSSATQSSDPERAQKEIGYAVLDYAQTILPNANIIDQIKYAGSILRSNSFQRGTQPGPAKATNNSRHMK